MAFERKTGLNVTVFTIGGAVYLGDLTDASITLNNNNEDGKGVGDIWGKPVYTKKNWELSGNLSVSYSHSTTVMASCVAGAAVAITVTTGAGTYTGSVLITSVGHKISKGVQTYSLSAKGTTPLALA